MKITLRRTKIGSNGKPLIVLPPKEVLERQVILTDSEKSTYFSMQREAKQLLQLYKNQQQVGGGGKKMSLILVALLRLRQICDHPSLAPGAIEALRAMVGEMEKAVVELSDEAAERAQKIISGADQCAICLDDFSEERITACGHVFCKECIMAVIAAESRKGADAHCPLCRDKISAATLYSAAELLPKDDAEDSDADAKDAFESSSKVDAILDEAKNILRDDPNAKIVIFSQFVGMLTILETAFSRIDVKTTALVGSLSQKKRKEVLDEFRKNDGPPIMLASLRAAGQGLNLQCAQHCFLTDPWWNGEVENQAIDRIHRIGQTKKVRIVRFVCVGTIEERVVKLQENKREMVSMMLSAQSRKDLSLQKLERVKILLDDE